MTFPGGSRGIVSTSQISTFYPESLSQEHKAVIESKSQAGSRKDCIHTVYGSHLKEK